MALHSSSGVFRIIFLTVILGILRKAVGPSFLLAWIFLLSAFVCCTARVPRHVTRGVMYCNYPKGGSPEGELTAQFRSAEALSYLQAVLKILQQFPYIFY